MTHPLCLGSLGLLLLLNLEEERAVDVGQHASKSDGGPDESIELFVAADGKLEVAGGYALDLEILGGILWHTSSASGGSGGQGSSDSPLRAPKLQQ